MHKKNLGLNLLRVWLSFEVVVDHYWMQKGLTGFAAFISSMRSLAVPCFLFMSFYLTSARFTECDRAWLKTRFLRLGIPFLVWPIIYFAFVWAATHFSPTFTLSTIGLTELKAYGFDLKLNAWNLIRQWLCGMDRSLLHQFWFHNNMIIWTALLFGLLLLIRSTKARIYTLATLFMLGLAIQYSPLNKMLFNPLSWEVKYSYGRLVATLPYAALGILVGLKRKELAALQGSMRAFLALCGLFALLFVFYSGCMPRPSGLGYQGLNLLVMAIGTVAFFHYLPLENAPAWLAKGIEGVSRYCMGIYCCHLVVGWALHAWLFPKIGVGVETACGCVLIWIASWLLCAILAAIPGRLSKDLVC